MQPIVSVIVPAYNAEATLRETLLSALASTYRDFELLVIDDGSTDGTASIADELAGTDSRIRVLRQPSAGLSAALNAALAAARGRYVARLDADDLWHPSKLQKQVELALSKPELAFIYTWIRYIDSEGCVVHDAAPQQFSQFALCRGVYESLVGGGSSAMIKRSAIVEAGGWDENLKSWMDLLLQLKIGARYPIGFVPEYLVGYRLRRDSLSSNPRRMIRIWRTAHHRLKSLCPEVPSYVHRWAHASRCLIFAEGLAWRGRYLGCAALLLEAMRNDPIGTGHFLAYRTARYLKRRRTKQAQHKRGPHFLDCDPTKRLSVDPFEQGLDGSRLRDLEAERIRHLETLDEKLAKERLG